MRVLLCLVVATIAVGACRQSRRAASQLGGGDGDFEALQSRGLAAMGVDQYTSSHRFDPLPDGGRIALQRDQPDSAGVARIRRHLQGIAVAFAQGRFDTPAFVHQQPVPGAAVMATSRDRITYTYHDLPQGGAVRILSHDSAAIAAIHQFLAFQRSDHHVAQS